MNVNYRYDGKNERGPMPKGVQVMVYMILGTLFSIGALSAAILAQIVIYLCTVIASLW